MNTIRKVKEDITDEQRRERLRRMNLKVIMITADGTKIRVSHLEMVRNDAVLIDWADNTLGKYENSYRTGGVHEARQLEIYLKAVELYGKTPYQYGCEQMGTGVN